MQHKGMSQGRLNPYTPALNVEKFLHADVSTESSFCDAIAFRPNELQRNLVSNDGAVSHADEYGDIGGARTVDFAGKGEGGQYIQPRVALVTHIHTHTHTRVYLLPCAMFAKGPAWTNTGVCSTVCIRVGQIASMEGRRRRGEGGETR